MTAPRRTEDWFAEGVLQWLEAHGPVIDALIQLRIAGEDAAVAALLGLDHITQLRVGWEFQAEVSSESAIDAALSCAGVPLLRCESCRWALWGLVSTKSLVGWPRRDPA